jgi:hypothetical protein
MKRDVLPRPAPPADRGPLLTPTQVAELIGGVSAKWVLRHVPGKLALGQKTKRWYRGDVLRWLEGLRPPERGG